MSRIQCPIFGQWVVRFLLKHCKDSRRLFTELQAGESWIKLKYKRTHFNMKLQYSAQVIWSEQDNSYLAKIAELPGCLADGQTAEEAVHNLFVIAQEWIEVANEEGRDIPAPLTVEKLRMESLRTNEEIQRFIQTAVQDLVLEAIEKQQQKPSQLSGLRFGVPVEFELAGKTRD